MYIYGEKKKKRERKKGKKKGRERKKNKKECKQKVVTIAIKIVRNTLNGLPSISVSFHDPFSFAISV